VAGIKHFFNRKEKTQYTRIQSASGLLRLGKRPELMDAIKNLLPFPSDKNQLFLCLIDQFAQFVQQLPENHQGLFAQAGEFLDHGLDRSKHVLQHCHDYFNTKISELDLLWMYSSFSAALCMDLGKISTKYRITLYDESEQVIGLWNPYTGAMSGASYGIDYVKENLDQLRRMSTCLLAKQLLNQAAQQHPARLNGLHWITSDPNVFQDWLSIFYETDQRTPMAPCMAFIPQSEIEVIQKYYDTLNLAGQYPEVSEFLNWLRAELIAGRIDWSQTDSNASIFFDGNHVSFSTGLFREFTRNHLKGRNVNELTRQFFEVLALFQIPVSELDIRYRAQNGVIGLQDLKIRYASAGTKAPHHTANHIVGGPSLIYFLMTTAVLNQLKLDHNIPGLFLSPRRHV
jgi:Putative helicase